MVQVECSGNAHRLQYTTAQHSIQTVQYSSARCRRCARGKTLKRFACGGQVEGAGGRGAEGRGRGRCKRWVGDVVGGVSTRRGGGRWNGAPTHLMYGQWIRRDERGFSVSRYAHRGTGRGAARCSAQAAWSVARAVRRVARAVWIWCCGWWIRGGYKLDAPRTAISRAVLRTPICPF